MGQSPSPLSQVQCNPHPIGPLQCAASLSCSNKKRTISGKLSLNASIPNGLWTRWRKDLTSPPERLLMGAPQVPNLPPMKLKTRVTLSFPTHKVFVKASKRSVVGIASKPTSKVGEPSRAYWSPPRTKTLWSTKVVPSTGTNAPSAIHHHSSQTGHPTNHNNFQIIGREGHNLARNIKESIYIRVKIPHLTTI